MPLTEKSRTLAVLIGASTFPSAPNLAEGRSFYLSAADVKDYLCDELGLGLPRRNVLSLFDDSRSPTDQLLDMAGFLQRRTRELGAENLRPEALIIYYVGHGLFTRGDQAYCLAVRYTNEMDEGATSIRASDLAGVIKRHAAFVRRYLIFDCCFAASVYKEFQSGVLTAAHTQVAREFPGSGTALLCSSSVRDASIAPQGANHTMFSGALIRAFREGHDQGGPLLSFSELGSVVVQHLQDNWADRWVRPELHAPDQREGDISHIPMFPNTKYRQLESLGFSNAVTEAERLRVKEEADRVAVAAAEQHREREEADRLAAATAEQHREREEADRLAAATAGRLRQREEADRAAAAAEERLRERDRLAAATAERLREREEADRAAAVAEERLRENEKVSRSGGGSPKAVQKFVAPTQRTTPASSSKSTPKLKFKDFAVGSGAVMLGIVVIALMNVPNFYFGRYLAGLITKDPVGNFISEVLNDGKAAPDDHRLLGTIILIFLACGVCGWIWKKLIAMASDDDIGGYFVAFLLPGFFLGFRLINDLSKQDQPSAWWALLCMVTLFWGGRSD